MEEVKINNRLAETILQNHGYSIPFKIAEAYTCDNHLIVYLNIPEAFCGLYEDTFIIKLED